MVSRIVMLISVWLLATAGAVGGEQDCYGPGDLSADGTVDCADFDIFASCMRGVDLPPAPECDPAAVDRGDSDSDGDLDMVDFAVLATLVDNVYFNYGARRDNLEAEMLAMVVGNKRRAPDREYDRIKRDLALIRAAYPELTTVIDDPNYGPDRLLVGFEGQPSPEVEALNDFYLLADEEIHGTWRLLTFCDNLNAELVAADYGNLPGVSWASPDYLIGIDDYITIEVVGTTYSYHIDDGFHDCFDGCDCHRDWRIDVDLAGNVTLISYEEWGWPYCEF